MRIRFGLAWLLAAVMVALLGASASAAPSSTTEMRGVWISTTTDGDWPGSPGLSPAKQQARYRALLDQAVANRMNAVFVQVRPSADAFWPGAPEPWSKALTGTQGVDPGYDPLRFLIDEAHARGLKFHAWFNPYRVGKPEDLAPNHPALAHPEWTFNYNNRLYYNPGVPQARKFVESAILDAVGRYDVDGVHLDDYFYPYPVAGQQVPDDRTFAQYGKGYGNIDDWRRHNVDLLVSELDKKVHKARPGAQFGISPFGIWRNAASDPAGSNTKGMESYSAIYADTRKWVRNGWVDYVAPQVYWPIGHPVADYAALVPWWAKTVAGTNVKLYIGQAAYKVGQPGWQDPAELSNHLTLNSTHPSVAGDLFFSARSLSTNAREAMARVIAEHY